MHYTRAPQPYAIPNLLVVRRGLIARACTWVSEARAHRVLCLLAGLWVISLFDLALTVISHREGLLHEANPVAAFVLARGPTAVFIYKAVLVAIGSTILICYRRRLLAEFTAAALLIVYAVVAVRWKWCYELYELAHTNHIADSELSQVGAWAQDLPAF